MDAANEAYREYLKRNKLADTNFRMNDFYAGWSYANDASPDQRVRDSQGYINQLIDRLRLYGVA